MYEGRFYTLHNILDTAGFIHKIVCSVPTLEGLLVRTRSFV